MTIRRKISSAITPDSWESGPSHLGPDDEAAESKRRNGNGAADGEREGEPEIEGSEARALFEERQAESGGEVVERDQRERAETPEHEGMREAGQRAVRG